MIIKIQSKKDFSNLFMNRPRRVRVDRMMRGMGVNKERRGSQS